MIFPILEKFWLLALLKYVWSRKSTRQLTQMSFIKETMLRLFKI